MVNRIGGRMLQSRRKNNFKGWVGLSDVNTRNCLKAAGIMYVLTGAWNLFGGFLAIVVPYAAGMFQQVPEMGSLSQGIRFLQVAIPFCPVFGLLALAGGIGIIRRRPWGRLAAEVAAWALFAFIIAFGAFLVLFLSGVNIGPIKVLFVGISILSMSVPAILVGLFIRWLRSSKVRTA